MIFHKDRCDDVSENGLYNKELGQGDESQQNSPFGPVVEYFHRLILALAQN